MAEVKAHKIDFDRDVLYEVPADKRPRGGCIIRRDPSTEADVIMYRQDPGVYYGANGLPVSSTMAQRAGFDTVKYAKERDKLQKISEFKANWERQHQIEDKRIVTTRGNYRLVYIVDVGYYVEHEDGTIMTPHARATSEEMGLDWLSDFAGPEVKNGDVPTVGGPSVGGADRRPVENGSADPNIRQPINKKATV